MIDKNFNAIWAELVMELNFLGYGEKTSVDWRKVSSYNKCKFISLKYFFIEISC